MAIKSTIYKATLQVADMDRHYYADHALTIARHPSETDERMMMRCLAFALNAGEALAFGKGLSDADEPDLWQRDLTGAIQLWIEVGQPDEKRILRACGRAGYRTAVTNGPGGLATIVTSMLVTTASDRKITSAPMNAFARTSPII